MRVKFIPTKEEVRLLRHVRGIYKKELKKELMWKHYPCPYCLKELGYTEFYDRIETHISFVHKKSTKRNEIISMGFLPVTWNSKSMDRTDGRIFLLTDWSQFGSRQERNRFIHSKERNKK